MSGGIVMNASKLFCDLTKSGVTFSVTAEGLKLNGEKEIIQNMLPLIQKFKNEIISLIEEDNTEVVYIKNYEKLLQIEPYVQDNKINKIYIDIETTGLELTTEDIVLIQIYAGRKIFLINTVSIGISGELARFYDGIKLIMENKDVLKVFHNAKFDIGFLKHKLFPDIRPKTVFDTYLTEKLITAGISQKGDHSLKSVAKKYTGQMLDKELQTSFTTDFEPDEKQNQYAANDVKVLESIFKKQREALLNAGLINTALLEFSIIPVVVDIELNGISIDLNKLKMMEANIVQEKIQVEKKLYKLTKDINFDNQKKSTGGISPINFNSPVQVKKILSKFGFKVKSTAIDYLKKIDHPFAKTLIEYRKLSKLTSSFIQKLPNHINPVTNRIHPNFHQLGTDTGRFTCQNPNLQQIPKEQHWRDLFKAPQGYKIITADYNQIELRILAEYSQDETFINSYKNGEDLHKKTASEMLNIDIDKINNEHRNIAKTINFGLCYGMTAAGLSNSLDIDTEKAQQLINRYFRAYPQVKKTLQKLGVQALAKGYSETLLGRKRYYKKHNNYSSQKSLERKGRNTPIQSTCGDILKKALYYLYNDLQGLDGKIINLVHDEIVVEVKKEQADTVKKIVETAMVRAGEDFIHSVPIEVGIVVDDVWRK
jgi:DNA polymerase I-like protein with 3'-5' exonuclease and polymerase domains